MCTKHRNPTWTVMLLLLSGVGCSKWKVEYERPNICALKGSSVVIPCSFDYPNDVTVQSVKWGHERHHIYLGPFIYDSETNSNSTRYQYIGDTFHNCSFKIKEVKHEDSGKHAFRFTSRSEKGQVEGFTGSAGSQLKVIDLKIVVTKTNGRGTYKEGDSVTLTCQSDCDGDEPSSFGWLKNGQHTRDGPVLQLFNISHRDSGNYSCFLKTQNQTISEVVIIDAEYGPRNTTVSVTPWTEVDVGSNLTLTCSSTANPSVESYTWFRIDDGDVVVGNQSELTFIGIHLHEGGRYFCRATNTHGHQNSFVVAIKVKARWPTFTRDVLIIATVAALVLTICIVMKRCIKKQTSTPRTIHETDCVEDPEIIYGNWPTIASVQSEKENGCEGQTTEIVYATVNISSKRKSNTQQMLDSCNKDDGVIYSAVCRGRVVNPSYMEQM